MESHAENLSGGSVPGDDPNAPLAPNLTQAAPWVAGQRLSSSALSAPEPRPVANSLTASSCLGRPSRIWLMMSLGLSGPTLSLRPLASSRG